ncbi:hypothetical protein ACLBKU_08235 [Erythrobacter sp. NE805]|uniref:hypothetical protein n=1 Tax=Erythrobacter sp. NE805 TaxID=3389875 RepID=UPI00396B0115
MAASRTAPDAIQSTGYGLAALSIGLGLAGLIAAKGIARRLGVPDRSGIVRAFGVRELASGAGLVARPRASGNAWGRVAGDVLDLVALAAVLRTPGTRKQAAWGGLAFVASALLADVLAGRAMRQEERRGRA